MPPELAMQLGPIALRHPVICGSGEHVSSLDQLKAAVDAGAAAVIAKSANESDAGRRQSDAAAWVFIDEERREVSADTPGASMLNRSGLVQVRWDKWMTPLAEADGSAGERGSWVPASVTPADSTVLPDLARDIERA